MSKIYVGNLPYQTDEDQLSEIFKSAGFEPVSVQIVKDRDSGQSKGFGFVTFQSDSVAQDAVAQQLSIGGRPLKLDMAKPKSEGFGGGGGGGGGYRGGGGGGGGGGRSGGGSRDGGFRRERSNRW